MSEKQIIQAVLNASPAKLKEVADVLAGRAKTTKQTDERGKAEVRLLTYTAAAKLLDLSRPTIYRLVRAGKLKTVTLSGSVPRITMKSVLDFAKVEE